MTEIDQCFERIRPGGLDGFPQWISMVEMPVRLSLRSYARAVDAESVLQETMMRMWVLAQGEARESMGGENASLRRAIEVARNIARTEASQTGCQALLPRDGTDHVEAAPVFQPDPELYEATKDCLRKLDDGLQPHLLHWRLEVSWVPDAFLAKEFHVETDRFVRSIMTAKLHVARCLEQQGIELHGEIETEAVHGDLEILLGLCSSAYRETSQDGRPIPPPGWWEMAPEARERAFHLRLLTSQMEILNGTQIAAFIRIAKTRATTG